MYSCFGSTASSQQVTAPRQPTHTGEGYARTPEEVFELSLATDNSEAEAAGGGAHVTHPSIP